MYAVTTTDWRAIELIDPANVAAPFERIPISLAMPRRICDPNGEGVLLGMSYDPVELTFEDEREITLYGLTRFDLRVLGETTCLAGLRLDTSSLGTGVLEIHDGELVGILHEVDTVTEIRCALELRAD